MATVTRSRKSVKFTCSIISLTLEINDSRYSVDEIPAGECGSKAYRLTKHSARDGGTYDVLRQHDGIVACDCPDFESRHRGNGYGMCKHGRALVELGLMPAPLAPEFEAPARTRDPITVAVALAPAVEPTPAPVEAAPIAPEPCCPESEPAPCLACLEAAPIARCVCEACVDDAQCDESEDMGPAEAWGPEWDIDAWMLGADAPEPDPSPEDLAEAEMSARELLNPAGPPTLTLAELVEKQVEFYLSWQTDAGDLIAGQLDQLASRIRFLDARSPAEFSARGDVMDRDDRDATYRQGFEAALAERRAMEAASAFGHSS